MIEITSATVCNQIDRSDPGGLVSLLGVRDKFLVARLPETLHFKIYVVFSDDARPPIEEFTLGVRCVPARPVAEPHTGRMSVVPLDASDNGRSREFSHDLAIDFIARDFGWHWVELLIDRRVARRVPFLVIQED